MIDEWFNLSKERAAKVVVELAKAVRERKSQQECINLFTGDEKAFAAFLVGLIQGLNVARIDPNKIESVAAVFGEIAETARVDEALAFEKAMAWLP